MSVEDTVNYVVWEKARIAFFFFFLSPFLVSFPLFSFGGFFCFSVLFICIS